MFKKAFESDHDAHPGQTTIIASGTEVKGDIEAKGDIRIDGILTGNLTASSKVLIGTSGVVRGDVTGEKVEVLGKVTGNIKVAGMLILKGNSIVKGNVYTRQLQVAPTASFNGECHMGAHETANIVAISNEMGHAASSD
jgi:cytoskeletal protein CcmA (bactofilin family)